MVWFARNRDNCSFQLLWRWLQWRDRQLMDRVCRRNHHQQFTGTDYFCTMTAFVTKPSIAANAIGYQPPQQTINESDWGNLWIGSTGSHHLYKENECECLCDLLEHNWIIPNIYLIALTFVFSLLYKRRKTLTHTHKHTHR